MVSKFLQRTQNRQDKASETKFFLQIGLNVGENGRIFELRSNLLDKPSEQARVLTLENSQIYLEFSSLIRIFATVKH